MALYLGKKKITPTKILREKQAPSNDLGTLMDGGIYSILTDSLIDQIMTGAYTVE